MNAPSANRFRSVSCMVALLGLWLAGCAEGTLSPRPAADAPARWAIRCAAEEGPNRYQRAQAWVAALEDVPGLRPRLAQAIEVDGESIVYYGRYQRVGVDEEGHSTFRPDPEPDLELIRSLSFRRVDPLSGQQRPVWPFLYATLEELPTGRSRHPEWDLDNAEGYWSLQVAVFWNEGPITSRRYLAEEYAAELREEGVDAYYHHGPAKSSVTVGMFPQNAVQSVNETDPLTGATTVTSKVVDERLLELQRRFPRNLQNGRRINEIIRDPATGEVVSRRPLRSFIVKVPAAARAEQETGERPAGP